MKSLDVSPISRLYSYCLWWRHCDGSDRFRHRVNADSIADAIDRSRVGISIALGTNAGFWEIADPRTQVSRQPEIDHAKCTGTPEIWPMAYGSRSPTFSCSAWSCLPFTVGYRVRIDRSSVRRRQVPESPWSSLRTNTIIMSVTPTRESL